MMQIPSCIPKPKRIKPKKIAERDQTGEKWTIYEVELPCGPVELILQYVS